VGPNPRPRAAPKHLPASRFGDESLISWGIRWSG